MNFINRLFGRAEAPAAPAAPAAGPKDFYKSKVDTFNSIEYRCLDCN